MGEPVKTEYCQACPVPHPFAEASNGSVLFTHTVDANGNTTCSKCSEARPCVGTVVPGRSGARFVRALREKPSYRGLHYDGNRL
jgi:hypothetical protein